jgi:hypothetical protein
MLFGDLTKGSYDFSGGSKVDVSSKSYQNSLSSLTLERGKMDKCMLSLFFLEHSTFVIRSNNDFYHILCMHVSIAMGTIAICEVQMYSLRRYVHL